MGKSNEEKRDWKELIVSLEDGQKAIIDKNKKKSVIKSLFMFFIINTCYTVLTTIITMIIGNNCLGINLNGANGEMMVLIIWISIGCFFLILECICHPIFKLIDWWDNK